MKPSFAALFAWFAIPLTLLVMLAWDREPKVLVDEGVAFAPINKSSGSQRAALPPPIPPPAMPHMLFAPCPITPRNLPLAPDRRT